MPWFGLILTFWATGGPKSAIYKFSISLVHDRIEFFPSGKLPIIDLQETLGPCEYSVWIDSLHFLCDVAAMLDSGIIFEFEFVNRQACHPVETIWFDMILERVVAVCKR